MDAPMRSIMQDLLMQHIRVIDRPTVVIIISDFIRPFNKSTPTLKGFS